MEDQSFKARMKVHHPELLQFYSFPTPNGVKVAAALEEIIELKSRKGELSSSNIVSEEEQPLLYEPHAVNIRAGENRLEWFKSKGFSTQKVPALQDPACVCPAACREAPGGTCKCCVSLFESGSILTYLADKYDALMPKDKVLHIQATNWLFYGSATVSTHFKLFGFYFKYCSHGIPYCVERYSKEVHLILSHIECALAHEKNFIVGDMYTIADISMWPWIQALFLNYDNAGEVIFDIPNLYPRVMAWYTRCIERPASKRAGEVCKLNFDV